jgi:hypothetical protein
MAFYKAAVRAAAVTAPAPDAISLDHALLPLMNGMGKRFDANYHSDYDAWLSADPGLIHFAAAPADSKFVGRRAEREMLCFVMKKVRARSMFLRYFSFRLRISAAPISSSTVAAGDLEIV